MIALKPIFLLITVLLLYSCSTDKERLVLNYKQQVGNAINLDELTRKLQKSIDVQIIRNIVRATIDSNINPELGGIGIVYPTVNIKNNCFEMEENCGMLNIRIEFECSNCVSYKKKIEEKVDMYIGEQLDALLMKAHNQRVNLDARFARTSYAIR